MVYSSFLRPARGHVPAVIFLGICSATACSSEDASPPPPTTASGGITGTLVGLFEEGLFHSLLDVQCFDREAVRSMIANERHREISASTYASPFARSAVVDHLDAVILGATEIDLDFNVNVHTDSNGLIMGGSGGHSLAGAWQ